MADKSFGVKELNLISASGTPTITSPNSVNINATNVAISTDITVGGMVSLGAGTSISSPGTNVLTFGTNSTEKVRIDSSGKFGIGTDNPNRLLHLKQSYGGGMLTIERTDSSSSALVIAADSGEIALFARDSDTGSTAVPFVIKQGGSTEALRITSGGDVSIGGHSTNYADSPLEVRSTNNGGDVAIRVTNNTTTTGSKAGIIFTNSTGDFTSAGIAHLRNDNALIFYNGQSAGAGGFDNATERLRITSDGNLGIGTDNPGVQAWRSGKILDIHGGAGNVTGELHIGANRGDGAQSVGSINFYDNTQNSSHRHVAIIEVDKVGSGTNTRGGDILFYNKVDGGTSTPVTFKIRSGGNCEIPDGNLVFASGHGIDFSATANGTTSSSELFDDYEEGSWTPSITLGGGSTGMTYSRQEGHYTKIGRQVFAQFRITLTAKGSSSGQLRINGLPFTSADTFSSTGIDGQVHIAHDNGFNAGQVSNSPVSGYVEGSTTYFLLTARDTNANLNTMTSAFIDSDLSISGTVIFYA